MRIALASDTHNEFYAKGRIPFLPKADADILVLAGDIQTVGSHSQDWWDDACDGYDRVIYIPGNHEYYKSYFNDYPKLNFPHNVTTAGFHENCASVTIDGLKFLLGCMWSDLSNPHSNSVAKRSMNDYRSIKYDRRRYWFTPDDTTKEFFKFKSILEATRPDVVISHHAPSFLSLNPRFGSTDPLAPAYYSHMDVSNQKLWIHGHTHHPVDYVQNGCRIVSNPMGYPGEIGNFSIKVIEVGAAEVAKRA